jgi:hypothetical protein
LIGPTSRLNLPQEPIILVAYDATVNIVKTDPNDGVIGTGDEVNLQAFLISEGDPNKLELADLVAVKKQ